MNALNNNQPAYGCRQCMKVSIKRDQTEQKVDEEVVRFLSSSSRLSSALVSLSENPTKGNGLVERNALTERLRGLTEDFYVHQLIPENIYRETAAQLNQAILRLDEDQAKDEAVSLGGFDPQDYLEMPEGDKRAFLQHLFSGIIVRHVGRGGRPDPDRLVFVYSEAASEPE